MPAKVLIVEDEESLRKASEIALRRAGYTVLSAEGGRQGLALARSEQPDLIILDLLMPAPTGLDVLRALRAEEPTRATPVLVVSNSSMQRVVEQVEGLGGEYIVKAELSLRELADRVARRLAEAPPGPERPAPPAAAPTPAPVVARAVAPRDVAARDFAAAAVAARAARAAAARTGTAKSSVPASAPDGAEDAPVIELETNCAGCGLRITTRFAFCPQCGRKLDRVHAVSAHRRFR
jgi:DNA-binding response OmpR family regulator